MISLKQLRDKLFGESGGRLTALGTGGGSFASPLGAPIIASGIETLRQLLYAGQDPKERTVGGRLKKVGTQAAIAEAGSLGGKVLPTLMHPIAGTSGLLGKLLGGAKGTVNTAKITEALDAQVAPQLERLGSFDLGKGILNRIKSDLINSAYKNLPKTGAAVSSSVIEKGVPLNVKPAYKLLQNLYEGAYGKGASTGLQNIAEKGTANVLRKSIGESSIPADILLKAISGMYKVGGGINKAVGSLPLGFNKLPEFAGSVARGTLSNRITPAAIAGLGGPLAGMLGGQSQDISLQNTPSQSGLPQSPLTIGQQGLPVIPGQPQGQKLDTSSLPADHFSPNKDWVFDPQQAKWIENPDKVQAADVGGETQKDQIVGVLEAALLNDFGTTGGKNSAKIISALNYFNKQAKQTTPQDRVASLNVANNAIDLAFKNVENAPEGLIGSKLNQLSLKQFGGRGVSDKVANLNTNYELLRQTVVRAFQGARMSDKDIEIAQGYIPTIVDEPRIAKQKLMVLKEIISQTQNFLQQNPTYNISSGDTSSTFGGLDLNSMLQANTGELDLNSMLQANP